MTDEASVLLGALAVDLVFGEPPGAVHPVVWMGKLQTVLRRRAPARPAAALLYGVLMAASGPVVFGGGAWWVLAHSHGLLRWLVAVCLLKSAFSVRELAAAALRVRRCLVGDDLPAARSRAFGRTLSALPRAERIDPGDPPPLARRVGPIVRQLRSAREPARGCADRCRQSKAGNRVADRRVSQAVIEHGSRRRPRDHKGRISKASFPRWCFSNSRCAAAAPSRR